MSKGVPSGTARNRRNWPVASAERPEWLELAEEAILYFGITLSPVLIVILLYQLGVIA